MPSGATSLGIRSAASDWTRRVATRLRLGRGGTLRLRFGQHAKLLSETVFTTFLRPNHPTGGPWQSFGKWYKDHPAFAGLAVKDWCRRLTTNINNAHNVQGCYVFKFCFEYTPKLLHKQARVISDHS